MNPEITKIIDQYLAGELSEKDRQIFEERLNSNPKLQEEVALQKDVVAGIKRSAQRVKIKQTRRNYFRSRLLKFGTIGLSSIALVGLVSYFAVSMLNSTIEPLSEELKSLLDKDAQFERIDAQYFQIPEEGGVVMSEKGVLLSVPKNAFLKNGQPYSGETIIQFQEAMDAEDIVTSGLSTMSGDRLLETQGMFSLRSYTKDGEELEVNPDVGVYAQAPVDEYKTGMQLFTGEKDASGNVDWQNPEPLYKLPVPVDMSELDFYPTEFEPYLDEQNWKKSKKSRDSLYLSFEDYCASEERGESERYMIGFDLYGNNCSTCHYIDKNATGPALRNARALWRENAEKPDLLYTWVRNWEKAALSSKWAMSRAQLKVTKQNNMTHLSNEDIDMIFDFIDESYVGIDEEFFDFFDYQSASTDSILETSEDVVSEAASVGEADMPLCYIPPSSVLGFWNKKFNNTNLATRAFEKRMRSIHNTCDNAVLDKYVTQLNKSISEIDKEVAAMGYPEFEQFAAENIGKIDVKNPHLENLREFYSSALNQLKKKSKKNRNKEKKRREKWDKDTQNSREKENKRRVYRETQALQEEYQFNLKNVKKQISSSVGFTIKHGGGTVYNIDKYVWDATVNRESMDRIDPVSGKRVKITYNDFTFSVADHDKYIKLYAYVFPHELNSYQRIEGKSGKFDYPLNDDILYDIGVIGITEDGYEYYQKQTFKKGQLGDISLKRISEKEMKASIKQLNKKRRSKPMQINDELQWLVREYADYKEQELRKEMKVFRRELSNRIFPCLEITLGGFESDAAEPEIIEVPAAPEAFAF